MKAKRETYAECLRELCDLQTGRAFIKAVCDLADSSRARGDIRTLQRAETVAKVEITNLRKAMVRDMKAK